MVLSPTDDIGDIRESEADRRSILSDPVGEENNACSSALCNFLHSPVTSSLLVPNIFLRTLFSNTLNLCSSLKVRVQVSQPYRITAFKEEQGEEEEEEEEEDDDDYDDDGDDKRIKRKEKKYKNENNGKIK
ncbi:hypothetical protein ANN_05154 [Periplaneta americana]|uniref:Uncharacterized protein n=1 Tax=Periplaneta americana TaxID=6978 RepID=A0ABQ8TC66_PERAM|nr:hypothetical protein ANN_05154 [Periplaneta americana]